MAWLQGLVGLIPGGGTLLAVVVILVSLALIFAGRALIKALVFIAAGLAGASLASFLAATYIGGSAVLIAAVIGFIVGGLLGVALLPLGIGIALGYVGYSVAQFITGSIAAAMLIGIILFVAGIFLAGRILVGISVALGGLMLLSGLRLLDLPTTVSAAAAVILAVIGLWVQSR